jgi:hypothetical protein
VEAGGVNTAGQSSHLEAWAVLLISLANGAAESGNLGRDRHSIYPDVFELDSTATFALVVGFLLPLPVTSLVPEVSHLAALISGIPLSFLSVIRPI